MLDINLFRKEKGGNPELIRVSQRKRNASVEVVDEIISLDEEWVKRKLASTEPHRPQIHAPLSALQCRSAEQGNQCRAKADHREEKGAACGSFLAFLTSSFVG